MRRAVLAVVAAAMTILVGFASEAAEPKVTRSELIKIATQADVTPKEFEEYTLKDGRNAVRCQQPTRGVMLAYIGPADDVSEVVAIVNAGEANFFQREFMLAQLVARAAHWDDGAEWTIKMIAETAKTNGGERKIRINGRTVVVGTVPPNLMRVNVSRD